MKTTKAMRDEWARVIPSRPRKALLDACDDLDLALGAVKTLREAWIKTVPPGHRECDSREGPCWYIDDGAHICNARKAAIAATADIAREEG